MSLPLEGIKVIDFTGVQAGPVCTQFLAWYGADVLKVERINGGDVTRRQLRDIPDVDALYFTQLNSNKRSLTLDTKTPEGKEIMEKLIRSADVLVENFAPGATASLATRCLGVATLAAEVSQVGFSSARVGRPIQTRISTSPFRSRTGLEPARPWESRSGSMTRRITLRALVNLT